VVLILFFFFQFSLLLGQEDPAGEEEPDFKLPEVIIPGEDKAQPLDREKKIFTAQPELENEPDFFQKTEEPEFFPLKKKSPPLAEIIRRNKFLIASGFYGQWDTFGGKITYGQEGKNKNVLLNLHLERSHGYPNQNEMAEFFERRGFEKIRGGVKFSSHRGASFQLNLKGFYKTLCPQIKKTQAIANFLTSWGEERKFSIQLSNVYGENTRDHHFSAKNNRGEAKVGCSLTLGETLYKIQVGYLSDFSLFDKKTKQIGLSNILLKSIFSTLGEKGSWGLNLGIKYSWGKDWRREKPISFLAPYFALFYAPFSNFRLELKLDRQLNIPSFSQLYVKNDYIKPNLNLEPEEISQVKLQIPFRIEKNISFIPGYSVFLIKKALTWQKVTDDFLFEPVNITSLQGGEEEAPFVMKEEGYFKIKIRWKEKLISYLSYFYQSARYGESLKGPFLPLVFPFLPQHRAEMKLDYEGEKVKWLGQVVWVSEQPGAGKGVFFSPGDQPQILPSYFVLNLYFQQVVWNGFSIFARGENLLDEKNYIDPFGLKKEGVNLSFGIKYKL
jgi:hypothetical protein